MMADASDNSFIGKELYRTVCGIELGRGQSRIVHACVLRDDLVVKVEEGSGSFQNVVEWEIWDRVKDTDFAKWFAPCHWISPCGSILIQSRTTTPTEKQYEIKVPAFFTDFKRTNYGMLGKQLVCHDYGTALVTERGLTGKMTKPKWWDL